MVLAVASQRALAAVGPGGEILQGSVERGDHRGVEVDQLGVGRRMRVMTDVAGRVFAADVFLVITKAGVTLDAAPRVALEAHCVLRRGEGCVVGRLVPTFEETRPVRSVRSVGARAAGHRAVVVVVAGGAAH